MKGKRVMRKESVAALFMGGLVGAGVAMVAAPRSGKEVRQGIGRFAEDANESVRDYVRRGKAGFTDLTDRGRTYVRGRKSLLTAAFTAGKEAYVKERERLARKG
jgi:gas vesicle protein